MLIQCITFVKIQCITCITLNYCLAETLPLGYRLHCKELGARWTTFGFTVISIHNFQFVQFALVKTVMNMQHEL